MLKLVLNYTTTLIFTGKLRTRYEVETTTTRLCTTTSPCSKLVSIQTPLTSWKWLHATEQLVYEQKPLNAIKLFSNLTVKTCRHGKS